MSGAVLYINLAWALWMLGIFLSIGTVKSELMAENYWLVPSVLAFAAFAHYGYSLELNKIMTKNEKNFFS